MKIRICVLLSVALTALSDAEGLDERRDIEVNGAAIILVVPDMVTWGIEVQVFS